MSFFKTELQILRVTGDKAAAFLHGQLTNSIKELKSGCGNFNLLLNTKGKVQASCHVLNQGCFFDLLADPNSITKLTEQLAKLAPLSGCKLELIATDVVFHFLKMPPEGRASPEPNRFLNSPDGVVVFRSNRMGVEGYDVICEQGVSDKIENWQTEGFVELAGTEVELLRIKNGVAKLGIDVTDTNLPQEAQLDNALHFEKGCYLGQEIIARLHYKGHVNKILTRFYAVGECSTTDNAINDLQGECVGQITSCAYDSVDGKTYFLGYVPTKEEQGRVYCLGKVQLTKV